MVQPFANYYLALRKKSFEKLQLLVDRTKTTSYKHLDVDLLAMKLQLDMLLTKLSNVYLKVSLCCMQKNHCWIQIIKLLLVTGATVIFPTNN